MTAVSPQPDELGWPFAQVSPYPGAEEDPLYRSEHIRDLYFRADPNFSGRFTVPVLWDSRTHTIVNNESAEIVRIFNEAFNDFLPPETASLDYYPPELQKEIDEVNGWITPKINSQLNCFW